MGKIGSHGTIHTFKNYFVTVFSAINFQFSANKRYPNIPLFSIFATLISFFVTIIIDLQQSLPLPINFAVVASGLYLFPYIYVKMWTNNSDETKCREEAMWLCKRKKPSDQKMIGREGQLY